MRPALSARQRYRKYGSGTFPALSNPPVLSLGDSIAAKEHFVVGIASNTLTRDGTTNPGRITGPVTNSTLFGTQRVALVNITDTSMEVIGRNNYQDATTTGVSIHTATADTYASGIPSFNPTTATTGTSAISNGSIIALDRYSHRGVLPHTNALVGGGMNIVANLGHPGALVGNGLGTALSTQAAAELAYAKQILATLTNPLVFWRMGINDIKPGGTGGSPNNVFAAAKIFLDGLTGLDGNGGNAVVVIRSCTFVGSAVTNFATLNEQVIGKCATSGAPTVLNVDSTQYSYSGTPMNTYNYQLYQYALAHPSKFIFEDVSSCDYNFAATCMYDSTHQDTLSASHTTDGTHLATNAGMLQGAIEAAALNAAGVTFPLSIPRSSSDATSPGTSRTRLVNRGPWSTTTVTTGFNSGGGVSTTLPKGGNAGQPSGWSCGRATGSGTMLVSVYDPGDGLGMWVNGECSAGAANDTVIFYPWSSSGVTPATLGITSTDQSELQFVFELRWDGARAAGVGGIYGVIQTNGSGLYGFASHGESTDAEAVNVFPDASPTGNHKISTGWIQMSNSSITAIIPQIQVRLTSITGVACNVGVRCVGINKR